jgi:hypothetical protein
MIKQLIKASALVLAPIALLASCDALDELLSVPAPSQVVASDLEDPNSAQLLVASVANEFRCAHTYHASASAITGNEWRDASNNTVMNIWDARIHDTSGYGSQYASADCGSGQPALYRPLSRTRWLADYVLGLLNEWTDADVPGRSEMIAEVAMYAGYNYTLFAEAMCELVVVDNGPIVTPAEAFGVAIERFDQAAAAGASGDLLNAVRVGKARAQLNLGQTSAAAGTASAVPEGFEWLLEFSGAENVTKNKQWQFNVDSNTATIAEPYRNFPCNFPWPDDMMSECMEELDPRVEVTDQERGHTNTGIALWFAEKYTDAGSPVQLASWEEAQLIVAEAAIEAGNYGQAESIFNTLRANAGLSPYMGPMDMSGMMDQLIEERAAELFLEGHHLWDLRRLGIRPYPAIGQDDGFGAVYGNQLCFDLPATEFQNNTSITGG